MSATLRAVVTAEAWVTVKPVALETKDTRMIRSSGDMLSRPSS
jgi:hypothetical protein